MTSTNLKFKIGDRVKYILDNTIHFTGTITKAEIKKMPPNYKSYYKPYTIKGDDGKEYYANEQFLQPA